MIVSKKPHLYTKGGEKQYKDYEKNFLCLFLSTLHDEFSFVVKVTVNIVCSVIYVDCACYRACCQCRDLSFVVSSSFRASCMRLSSFRMCHFTLFFNYYLSNLSFNSFIISAHIGLSFFSSTASD